MAQKEFKKGNFAKDSSTTMFFFGDILQYISWSVKNSKTVDMLPIGWPLAACWEVHVEQLLL